MVNKNQKSLNKFEAHAIELKAAVEAERCAEDRYAEASTNLSSLTTRLNKGDETVTPAAYAEARAAVEVTEILAKAKARATKMLRNNAPWDPILAEQLAVVLREGFPGLNVAVSDRPTQFTAEVPTLVVHQAQRAREHAPGVYSGDVRIHIYAPAYMSGMFRLDNKQVRKVLDEARRGTFRLDDVLSNTRELAVRALAVWDDLPRIGLVPTDDDALSAAESLGRAILRSTEMPGRTEMVHINGNYHTTPMTTVKVKPLGGKILSNKVASGKRTVIAEAYLDAWPNPNLDGLSDKAGRNAVEHEAKACAGTVLHPLGRVTNAEVRIGAPEGKNVSVCIVTLTAEAAA